MLPKLSFSKFRLQKLSKKNIQFTPFKGVLFSLQDFFLELSISRFDMIFSLPRMTPMQLENVFD